MWVAAAENFKITTDSHHPQLGESGYATYEQATTDTRDVALTGKCIVFLIRGAFEVGEEKIHGNGLAYPIEDESSIRLQQKTVVVIIKKN
jgi:hypothetical protein